MKRIASAFLIALTAPATAADRLSGLVKAHRFALDAQLREVSGLTPASANSVFAHDDEYAIIHEISLEDGRIIRSFALGKPTVPGDFEGITRVGDVIYLTTSKGVILEASIAKHGHRSRFNMYETGAGDICNIEGIAPAAEAGAFLLLCKFSREEPQSRRLQIFEWSLKTRLQPARLVVDRPYDELLPKKAAKEFRPSDIYRDGKTGEFFILTVSGGVLQLNAKGEAIRYQPLDEKTHPQPEGLAIMANGDVIIADEGKKRAGELTVYTRR
ncbi:MAG: hypothetical protein R3C60_09820 [Parvularculaceae bacterium]